MTAVWLTILVLAVATFAIRAAGPVAVGGRELPRQVIAVITLTAPALLAALVITQTLTDASGEPVVDERLAGVAAAGGVMAWRDSILLAGAAAMLVTAGLRAL